MPFYECENNRYAFASQKNYMSFYLNDSPILERYKKKLGKLDYGKNCIRFRRLDQLPLDVLKEMLIASVEKVQAKRTDR
jgi:hypothetical protein